MDIQHQVGDIVLAWRRYRGWTQDQLADRAGLDRTWIVRVESGEHRSRTDTLVKLATALEIEGSNDLDRVARLLGGPPES